MPLTHVTILARIPLVREGLRALLSDERDFEITTLASSDDTLDDIHNDEPDVLLLDVQVLEREGWGLLDHLVRTLPRLTLLVIGDEPQDRRAARALELGARGYLLSNADASEMANAIRAAHSGSIILHPQIAAALLDDLRTKKDALAEKDSADESDASDLIEPLSERELDVLRLMTRGMANKQIAAELYITEHTVKFHIRSILGKLGAANRTEAVTLGLQKGLVSL